MMVRVLWSCAVVALVGSGSAIGAVTSGLGVTAPVRLDFQGDVELLGPRSVLVLQVPVSQATANAMTDGQVISIGAMYGVSLSGSLTTGLVDLSSAIVSPPVYDNSSGSAVTIDLKLVPNIEDFFLASNLDGFEPGTFDDVVAVKVRLTTADRNLNTDGVETFYDDVSFSEDGDRSFTIDQTPPQIVAAYHEHPNFWVEFSELLSSGQSANDANHTVLASVNGSDFQTSPSAGFTSFSPGGGTPFSPIAFVSPNTIQVNAGPAINLNLQPGRYIRCRADDAGLPFSGGVALHDVRDIAGNVAFQQDGSGAPVTVGARIVAGSPPIYRQWLNPGAGGYTNPSSWAPSGTPGLNDTLRIDRPPSVTASLFETQSESRRLWIGGEVTLDLGDGDSQASFLTYSETSEPSLVVGYEQLFGTLHLTNSSFVSTSLVECEWTNVGGPGAGIATLNVGTDVEFRTGKLLVEGPPATLRVEGTALVGFDNGAGDAPPDFETLVSEGMIDVAGSDGFLDAHGPVTIGALGTLRVEDGGFATLNRGLTVLSGGAIQTEYFVAGGSTPGFGISVLGRVALSADAQFSGLTVFRAGASSRLEINGFDGNGIDLVVDGAVELAGTLRLGFDPAFNPAAEESFAVMTSNVPINGRFALHILPAFPDDRVATIEYVTPALGAQAVFLSIETLPSIIGVDETGDSTPVAGQPVTAAAGDLNGDGFDDLAVVVPDQNPALPGSVLVFINNADMVNPGFSNTLQLTVGPDPTDVAMGDFDAQTPGAGQSDLDLAVTCAGDDSLRIYQNDGTATAFPQVALVGVAGRPVDVDAADVNGDERDDLVVTCRDADVVRVLVNESTLAGTVVSFAPRAPIAAGDEPVDSDPVDLDNDKDLDVVTGNFGSGTVGFSTNDSDGNFGPSGFAQAGNGPSGVDSGDIDGDLDADVVVANLVDGTVSVMGNTGGVLASIGTIPVGSDARSIVLIDLDNDNDNDIAVIAVPDGSEERQIRILRNDTVTGGPPTFAAASSLGAGNGPVYILTGDVNNDGRNDLISVDTESASNAAAMAVAGWDDAGEVLGSPGDGSVTVYLNYTTPSPACAGDANLDGRVDGKDLSGVLAKFGQAFPPLTGPNLNGDLVVNSADLSVVLSTYGSVCLR